MNIRVRLVHADSQLRIVVVEAFEGERCLGSTLGEAASAEEAEDRARERLRSYLPGASPRAASGTFGSQLPSSTAQSVPAKPEPKASQSAPQEPNPADPEDWSADLAAVDAQLRHLGWGREQEGVYVQRLFGQPNRSRLTRYADLTFLQRALAALPQGSQPESAEVPLRRSDLLEQCDGMLARLGWTTDQARQALEQHFAVTSRQRLSDEQLLAFNILLEGELLRAPGPGAAQAFA